MRHRGLEAEAAAQWQRMKWWRKLGFEGFAIVAAFGSLAIYAAVISIQ